MHAQTMTFAVFIVYQLFNVLNCRSNEESVFELGFSQIAPSTTHCSYLHGLLLFFVQLADMSIPLLGIEVGSSRKIQSHRTIDGGRAHRIKCVHHQEFRKFIVKSASLQFAGVDGTKHMFMKESGEAEAWRQLANLLLSQANMPTGCPGWCRTSVQGLGAQPPIHCEQTDGKPGPTLEDWVTHRTYTSLEHSLTAFGKRGLVHRRSSIQMSTSIKPTFACLPQILCFPSRSKASDAYVGRAIPRRFGAVCACR